MLHEFGQIDDHLRESRQVGPETLEELFELGNDKYQQDDRDDHGDDQHRGRIEEGLLDLLFQGLGFFLIGGDLVEQRLERARLLARLDEVDEQVVEIQRMLAERLMERGTGFDIALDVEDQFLHRRLVVTVADDLECLYERDTRGQHRGELAAEYGDVL